MITTTKRPTALVVVVMMAVALTMIVASTTISMISEDVDARRVRNSQVGTQGDNNCQDSNGQCSGDNIQQNNRNTISGNVNAFGN